MSLTGFSRRITWADFRSVEESEDPPHQADTHARISVNYAYNCSASGTCTTRNVVVAVRMDTEASWAMTGAANRTTRLLAHEQGHYDLTALGARDIERRVRAISGSDGADIEDQKETIRGEVQAEIDAMNTSYDDDTNHGLDTAAQTRWTGRIASAKANPQGTLSQVAAGSP